MENYHVYKLDFYGTDKFYIGCTIDIGRRFEEHKNAENWIDLFLMPKTIKVLKVVHTIEEAHDTELKWINQTWEGNLNKVRAGYGWWLSEIKKRREAQEFVAYQTKVDMMTQAKEPSICRDIQEYKS